MRCCYAKELMQNSFRRKWMLEQPLVFTGCSSIQFFNSPHSLNTVSEAAQGNLPLTMQHLCDLGNTMLLHCSPSASHPNPCLGKQRISLGVGSILWMYLCPHTKHASHRYYLVGFIYLVGTATEHHIN